MYTTGRFIRRVRSVKYVGKHRWFSSTALVLNAPKQYNQNHSKPRYGLTTLTAVTNGLIGWFCSQYFNSSDSSFLQTSTTKITDISSPVYATPNEVSKAIEEITTITGPEYVKNSAGELLNHSDNSSNFHKPNDNERPDMVVYPGSIEEVAEVVKVCYKYHVPMVPFSGGTSIEGHFIPTRRGICIDVSRLNNVIAIHEDDLDVVVQPGVGWQELGEYLEPYGLMFGPDPGPGAMIGGMVATSCSGTNASRYGTMKENVIALKVVLADGTIVKTKNRPRKSSSGYNLTGLFVGSEGTLGIVVEATLKLHVRPENEVVAIVNFNAVGEAAKTVTDVFKKGIQVNAVELMDDRQMKCFAEMGGDGTRKWSDKNLLLFKISGTKNGLKDNLDEIKRICEANNGFNIEVATDEEEKEAIWRARKTQLWTSLDWAKKVIPDARSWPTDVAVPVSALPQMISETVKDIESHGLLTTVVGHVGDGNIHALVIFPKDKLSDAETVVHNMVKRAISYEGTVSGEHGVGIGKREFLEAELGEEAVSTMRRIKMALDPLRLFNPDKIFTIDPNEDRVDNF
ncbi:unnamed protein product [Kuraishia capsulata CBS 1993]|uniref:D-lactate dehydrogenase (cytochrome) n=1 Tax=Kuraishia capsulata CBS 1993 TaxID=1382522 RepID=W6MFY5_9ASCO|nr:uncharacterized protein KUCA_T00000841001 [Kuraishia capsulata CBS 1993]CDK24874.1 unnamed protein product [Kuraishia capsulata CBS 1993]